MLKEHWFIILTGIFSGTLVFGGKLLSDLGLSLFQIAVFTALFSIILLPLVLLKKKPLTKSALIDFATYGLIGALLSLCEFGSAIIGVPVAVVVLLLYTQPFWTTLLCNKNSLLGAIPDLKVGALRSSLNREFLEQ